MKRWGEGLTHDEREEVRAAGRAILLLTEEIESLHIDLWHAHDQGATAPPDGVPADLSDQEVEPLPGDAADDGDVNVKLRERLSAFRFSHR
jgi:hypothetical protein